ncbi:MAG: response regulator [Lachnospiraceae bacterium]|nr:response regulator [Lachnospiraceae bacterium]
MIRKNHAVRCIFVLCLAMIMAGSVCHVNVKGSDISGSAEKVDISRIGGGYAASEQIPGVYFLPVLYDASNGLPTSEANYILADSKGYIWIGGSGGIRRFDGVSFEEITLDKFTDEDDEKQEKISSGENINVRSLFEDSRGRIWIGTNDRGVIVIDGQNIKRFKKQENGLLSDSIRTFAEDAMGNVFIGTTSGVAYADSALKLNSIEDGIVSEKRVLRLVTDRSGDVYGHTSDGIVFKVSTGGIKEAYESLDLGIKKITTILADPERAGYLYFGTSGQKVYHGRFGDNKSSMETIVTDPAENIHWLDHACGRLWVSSTSVVGYVDTNGKFVERGSLPIKNSFEMMTHDLQGNLWFASSRYGIMKIVADNFLDLTGAAVLEPEIVNAVCRRGDYLYAGTDNGLRIIDSNYSSVNNEITEYFKDCRIRCIMNDSKGNTWFSIFSGKYSLVCLNAEGKLRNYNVNNGLPVNEIMCTYEMNDGTFIVGTKSGVALFRNGFAKEVYGAEQGLKNTNIMTVCEGHDGEVYAGTDGDGIYIIRDGALQGRIGTDEGLGSDIIMRLKKDKDGIIWVITASTVEYIKDGNIVKTPNNTKTYKNCYDVVRDENDQLWFLSLNGVYVISAENAINDSTTGYKLFDRSNGLTSIPVPYCYGTLGDNGILYIAGNTGISAVDTEKLYDFSGTTRLGIKSLYYAGKEIFPDERGDYILPEENGLLQIDPVVFDHTITNPLIRVYLEGMNDEGKKGTQKDLMNLDLEYSRLKYGNYTLHIQILDKITESVLSERTFRIEKKPAFFERLSVRIIMMLLALAAIGILVWRIMTNTVIRKQYVQIQEARDEADRANSAKSRFLANMSHEIRTPINTIIGMDEMILRENAKDVKREYFNSVTGYARDIKYASESLLNLINDLLDISKIESGKAHLVEQEYDTVELLRGIASMIRGRAEDKKLYFDLNIDETLPKRLYGDGGKIKQIILNILTNAVKYTDEGGFTLNVKVTGRNEAGVALRISVKDTGIGIKPDDIERLFTAYERLDEVKNSNIQGTGLGLDISKQFAEMMGGKLWCESVYGEGSEFLFTLKQKIADPAQIGVFLEKTDESSGKAYKPQFIAPDADILVVDDNPMNLNVIKGLLKPTKIFVTTAASGEECLEKIAVSDFNVVLLDHMMPGMDGIETLERIRADHPDLPVYALTANSTAGGEEFYTSKGFNGYLTKPIDIVAVEHAIMRHLPENIMSKPTEEDEVQEETDLSEDMRWLEDLEGISVPDGIKNSGGVSQFIFSLNMFYDSIEDNASVIEKAYDEEDIKLATVKVHALKSSARIIGALKLSQDCQEMEDAGNRKDTEYIFAHKEKLLADYRKYKDRLKKLKNADEADGDKQEISESELKDAYSTLKDCIDQMDYDAVEMILTQLKEYKLPQKDEEIVTTLNKALQRVDWEQMEEVVGKCTIG